MTEMYISRRLFSTRFVLFLSFFSFTILTYLMLQNALVTKTVVNSFRKIYLVYESSKLTFDPDRNVLVFLHIQKTGGSDFDRAIVKHLLVKSRENALVKACEKTLNTTDVPSTTKQRQTTRFKQAKFKKFQCLRNDSKNENWYFSRQTFGWVCGLHPDISDLKTCVSSIYPNTHPDDFVFFTILRHPVNRYISEWKHVARGATWIRHKKNCLIESYERCFGGRSHWDNVTLAEFMSCKHNLASNRQTRMLAFYDSHLRLCDSGKRTYEEELLRRAKQTLKSMRFFAINEYQHLSQLLFEKTFGKGVFKLNIKLEQTNVSFADTYLNKLGRDSLLIAKIQKLNKLDIHLYEYAVRLFRERLNFFGIIQ